MHAFDSAVAEQSREQGLEQSGEPSVEFDAEFPPESIDAALVAALDAVGPYGVAFPAPLLLARGVKVRDLRVFAGEHLSLDLESGSGSIQAMAFSSVDPRAGIDRAALMAGHLDLLYAPQINEYRGSRRIQLRVERYWSSA